MTNKTIFCGRSHPDLFCKKERCSKVFDKNYRKARVQASFSKKFSGCRPAILFEEAHAKVFSCDVFNTLQNSFFIVHP